MPRGGERKGAGRKSSWQNSKTTLIRVPEVLSEQLVDIAHKLDRGDVLEIETKSKQLLMPVEVEVGLPGPQTAKALARRLSISQGTLGKNKRDFDWRKFAKWTYMYDPDDLHWAFDERNKTYYVVDYKAQMEH